MTDLKEYMSDWDNQEEIREFMEPENFVTWFQNMSWDYETFYHFVKDVWFEATIRSDGFDT